MPSRRRKIQAENDVAVNFVAVLLFVPETRYDRDTSITEQSAPTSDSEGELEKVASAEVNPIRTTPEENAPQLPKKTFVQDLSLWSGTPPTNLVKMFIRQVFQLVVAMKNR